MFWQMMHLQKYINQLQNHNYQGFSLMGWYPDFLHIKIMTENPKTFQAAGQSVLAEQNLQKRFN